MKNVKITTQVVVLATVMMLGLCALVVGLAVYAKWDQGAIIGLLSALGTIAAGLVVALGKLEQATENLDAQNAVLEQIVQQTNGLTEAERQDLAERAASAVVRRFRGPTGEWRPGGPVT